MGNEISNYQRASANTMRAAFGDTWPIHERDTQVRVAEDAWSVEVAVVGAEIYADGYHNRAIVRGQALVRYAAKAPAHQRLAQAVDIAATLGAAINHGTMWLPDPDDANQRVSHGEIVQDVMVFTEAETAVRQGVRVATGGYQVILQWKDEMVIDPQIAIEGYTPQAGPTAPPGQPDLGGDTGEIIERITLNMPPDGDYWRAEVP